MRLWVGVEGLEGEVDEEVGELQVPVDDVTLVDVLEAYHHLLHDEAGFLLRELAPYSLQVVQVRPVAVLEEKVIVVCCSLEIHQSNHVRVTDFVQNFYLVLQIISQALVHLVALLHFASVYLSLVGP